MDPRRSHEWDTGHQAHILYTACGDHCVLLHFGAVASGEELGVVAVKRGVDRMPWGDYFRFNHCSMFLETRVLATVDSEWVDTARNRKWGHR